MQKSKAPFIPQSPPKAASQTRILIADDDCLVRKAILRLLSAEPAFEVVGEAANGKEAVTLFRTLQPDAVVMDVYMPLMNGIEATGLIRKESQTAVVIGVSSFGGTPGQQMRLAGANEFLDKTLIGKQLLKTLLGCLQTPDTPSSGVDGPENR